MAIKGKRKGKARSGRTVTAGPRPAYVPPRTPLSRRTGTKVVVVVLLEALLFAILIGFDAQSDGERERAAINEVTQLVEAALFQEGVAQPLPAGALVLPELGQAISTLGTEEAKPKQIAEQAEAWSAGATAAAEDVGAVRVPEEGLDPKQRVALIEARDGMQRGLLAYATLADLVRIAARGPDRLRQDLVAAVQEEFLLAGETFDTGYSKLQEVRRQADLPTGTTPPGPIPGGAPGGIPGLPGFPGGGP